MFVFTKQHKMFIVAVCATTQAENNGNTHKQVTCGDKFMLWNVTQQ